MLTVLLDKVTNVAANNASTNAVLANLRVAIGTLAIVPADLAVV